MTLVDAFVIGAVLALSVVVAALVRHRQNGQINGRLVAPTVRMESVRECADIRYQLATAQQTIEVQRTIITEYKETVRKLREELENE